MSVENNQVGHNCDPKTVWALANALVDKESLNELADDITENILNGKSAAEIDTSKYFKTNRFNNPEDVQALADGLTNGIKEKLKARTVVTNVESREAAEAMLTENVSKLSDLTGEDKNSLLNRLIKDSKNLEEATINSVASKAVIEVLADRAREAAKGASNLDPKSLEELKGIASTMQKLLPADREAGSGAGRLLQSRQNADTASADIADILQQPLDPVDMAESIKMADSKAGRVKIIKGLGKATTAYRINAMLSGTGTHIVNNISTAIMTVLTPAEKIIGGAFTFNRHAIDEGIKLYSGLFQFAGDSLSLAARSFKAGPILKRGDAEKELLQNGAYSAADFGAEEVPILNTGINWLGNITGLPSRLLWTADEFWKQSNYRSMLNFQLGEEATREGLEPGSKEWLQYIQENFNSHFDKQGRGTNTEALDYAGKQTFTTPLTEQKTMLSYVGRYAQASHNIPGPVGWFAQNILPFITTPTNLLQAGLDHIPILNMAFKYNQELLTTPEGRAQIAGQTVVGSLLVLLADMAQQSGSMTGMGPLDYNRRKEMMKLGWSPNSLLLKGADGNTSTIPLNYFEPFGTVAIASANLGEVKDYLSKEEYDHAMEHLFASTITNLTSKKYLTGALDFADLVSSGANGDVKMKFFNNFAGSFVPSIVNDVRRLQDPHLREVHSIIDAAQKRSPFHSKNLPLERTALGDPVNDPLFRFWSVSKTPDDVEQELIRLNSLGPAVGPLSSHLTQNISLNDFRNKDGKTAYDRYGELLGELKDEGMTLRDALRDIIKSKDYKKLNDPFTVAEDEASYPGGKLRAIKIVLGAYRTLARTHLFSEDFKNAKGESLLDAFIRDKEAQAILEKENPPQEQSQENQKEE